MRIFFVALLFFSVLSVKGHIVNADEFSSANFKVFDPVIKPGAGFSTSSGFQLWGSLEQQPIGISNSSNFGVRNGFFYFPAPAAPLSQPSVSPVSGGQGVDYPAFPKKFPVSDKCDFNGDSRCNIIDLSILIFHYGRSAAAAARYDLSGNGTVDFSDISILFYYWSDL